jgi:hypothetical protein
VYVSAPFNGEQAALVANGSSLLLREAGRVR